MNYCSIQLHQVCATPPIEPTSSSSSNIVSSRLSREQYVIECWQAEGDSQGPSPAHDRLATHFFEGMCGSHTKVAR